uniref:Uncharacterized protein n=1 Tax=Megaselia scalaris TaxID=36166 RepID=T1H0Z0_MEGSC
MSSLPIETNFISYAGMAEYALSRAKSRQRKCLVLIVLTISVWFYGSYSSWFSSIHSVETQLIHTAPKINLLSDSHSNFTSADIKVQFCERNNIDAISADGI